MTSQPWRIRPLSERGKFPIYEGDVRVATAYTAAYAKQIVQEHNAALEAKRRMTDEIDRAAKKAEGGQ